MVNEQLKLSELNGMVKKAVGEAFTSPIWVVGEISELKTNRSGHCYLVLIEKDENSDAIVAQAKATIWSYTFRMLQPYFVSITGQQLKEGLKVLVSVSVEFHELYGYSLNIRDIDPIYTLGDMARRRLEIISRLKAEGVADMNKELSLPLVPQKIAIISSATAAGYEDFVDQLFNNKAGFIFHTKLFPAIMQGTQAEQSIIGALEQIYLYEDFFDVVVIIRGGGSQADLSCFDNFNLAYYITQFPLPVITGIGHEKDDSIVDLVANTRLKTPTAVAEFLISGVSQFDIRLNEFKDRFVGIIGEKLDIAKKEIEQFARMIAPNTREKIMKVNSRLNKTIRELDNFIKKFIQYQENLLNRKETNMQNEFKNFAQSKLRLLEKTTRVISGTLQKQIKANHDVLTQKKQRSGKICRSIISDNKHHLDLSLQKALLTDPILILERGYSITKYNGQSLKNADVLYSSAFIETRLYKGNIISEVKTINKEI